MGAGRSGISPAVLDRMAVEIGDLVQLGVQVAAVIGGGNILRGAELAASGVDRVTADQMGMLATVINALALQSALEKNRVLTRVMSALQMHQVCEDYIRRRAVRHLEKRRVVIFAGGTGNPFFTTDSAASLRGVEIDADLVLKATKVDGVYSADPVCDPTAQRYSRLTYEEVLQRDLKVMDATAVILCRDHNKPIRVFDMTKPGAMRRVVMGEDEGTLISGGVPAAGVATIA